MTAPTPTVCPDCRDGLEHCHGVLVMHRGEVAECIHDPDCAGDIDRHEDVVSCLAALRSCSCVRGAA